MAIIDVLFMVTPVRRKGLHNSVGTIRATWGGINPGFALRREQIPDHSTWKRDCSAQKHQPSRCGLVSFKP